MTETKHLCDLWQHTIVKIFNHDPKSELGIMIKEWVIFNKLENFNSLLNYTIGDFTPSGKLCYINENGEILHQTPLHELFNLRWYIQHLIHQSENENENPPSVYSTRHLSSAEDKNFPFCPQLRTQKTYGKQMLLSKPSTMAYLTMVVLPSWQLLTQYYTN